MTLSLTPNPSWLEGVRYDGVQRCHSVDGRHVPSVTQVLDRAYPDRFARIPGAVLSRKAALGTAVHRAAHYHAERDLVEASVTDDVAVRFAAWHWFTETRQVETLLVGGQAVCETVVCSRDLGLAPPRRRPYIGKLDFLCVVERRIVVLLDLKTGRPSLAGLQTLAYLDALYQQYPQLIAVDVQRWAVELTERGRYVVHVFRDDATDARTFREALECAYDAEWSQPYV